MEIAVLSYSKGRDVPLLEQTIWETFRKTAARFPSHPALISRHQGVRWSFEELAERVERVAHGLAGLGLKARDRAGIWSSNCAEWILLQLACARAGVVLVNVNPAYRSWELRYVLNKSRIRAMFLWERDRRTDYRKILDEASEGQSLPLEHVIYFGGASWDGMLERVRRLRTYQSPIMTWQTSNTRPERPDRRKACC